MRENERPRCIDCGGELLDLLGRPLPSWHRLEPRCVECNNAHVRRTQLEPSVAAAVRDAVQAARKAVR